VHAVGGLRAVYVW